jgi:hypothetical protein
VHTPTLFEVMMDVSLGTTEFRTHLHVVPVGTFMKLLLGGTVLAPLSTSMKKLALVS